MQKFTQKYTLVHLIQDLPAGYEYSMQDWPLHVTLADVFAIDGTPDDLLASLSQHLRSHKPFEARVAGDEWFGEDRSVHVRLLDKTNELQNLHEAVLEVLSKCSVTFNSPEYTGTGFRPHSTVQKSEQLGIGDAVVFDSITLVDMFPDENPYQRRVLGTVNF